MQQREKKKFTHTADSLSPSLSRLLFCPKSHIHIFVMPNEEVLIWYWVFSTRSFHFFKNEVRKKSHTMRSQLVPSQQIQYMRLHIAFFFEFNNCVRTWNCGLVIFIFHAYRLYVAPTMQSICNFMGDSNRVCARFEQCNMRSNWKMLSDLLAVECALVCNVWFRRRLKQITIETWIQHFFLINGECECASARHNYFYAHYSHIQSAYIVTNLIVCLGPTQPALANGFSRHRTLTACARWREMCMGVWMCIHKKAPLKIYWIDQSM